MNTEQFFWVVSEFVVLNLLALVFGLTIGRKRRIGFFWTYALSVFVNPVVGLLALISPRRGKHPAENSMEKPLGIAVGVGCAITAVVFLWQVCATAQHRGFGFELLGRLYGMMGFGLSAVYWFTRHQRNERLRAHSRDAVASGNFTNPIEQR